MESLFYIAKRLHNTGDILGGGNFGRGYENYFFDVNTQNGAYCGWRLASEMIVEDVRKNRYAHMPSRFTCSFAYPDEQEASKTVEGGTSMLHLYEVEPVDPTKICHIVAFNLMSSINRFVANIPFASNNRALAEQYWSGQGITVPEVITESPLRIIRYIPWHL